MKKIYLVLVFLIVLIVGFLGITYSYEYNGNHTVSFKLEGPSTVYVNLGNEYYENGVVVTDNGYDVSKYVIIDASDVDLKRPGEYKVKYQYIDEYIYRNVIVVDKIPPVIELIGDDVMYVSFYEEFEDPGYKVTDNYDDDLDDAVVVSGEVNTWIAGEYLIKYEVSDSSKNTTSVTRKVIVGNKKSN